MTVFGEHNRMLRRNRDIMRRLIEIRAQCAILAQVERDTVSAKIDEIA